MEWIKENVFSLGQFKMKTLLQIASLWNCTKEKWVASEIKQNVLTSA